MEPNYKGSVASYLESINFDTTKELVDLYKSLDNDISAAERGLSSEEGVDMKTATFFTGLALESKKLKQKVLSSLQNSIEKEQEIEIKKIAANKNPDGSKTLNLVIPTFVREFIDGKWVMNKSEDPLSLTTQEVE